MSDHHRPVVFLLDPSNIKWYPIPMQAWQSIQQQYPSEHVLIVNPRFHGNLGQIEAGDVVDHAPDLDTLLSRCDCSSYTSYAIKFTGDLGAAIGQRGMMRIIEND